MAVTARVGALVVLGATRLASNVAIAGQNELNDLTLNQNVVVTLPGSTRFYMVIQKGTTPEKSPAEGRLKSARSPAPNNNVPSLQELRQLLELRTGDQPYIPAGRYSNRK